jgi:formylglycine-generating enzyme required for sulfatase activity
LESNHFFVTSRPFVSVGATCLPLPRVAALHDPALHDPPQPDMIWVPGGEFLMGSDHQYPEEAPAHRVSVDGFWIDRAPVTNARWSEFVDATGHVTFAERVPDASSYPGAKPELLVAASMVFVKPARRVDLRDHYNWWTYVPGADWRHPQGPGSAIDGLDDHPVVHVSWEDVEVFAAWSGTDLPTEAEWERAAWGTVEGTEYAWGDRLYPDGRMMANIWQGDFPAENLKLDGYEGTSPVGAFPPNSVGLVDMIGNVWEWTQDWYEPHGDVHHACCTVDNPLGGERERSYDPAFPDTPLPRKVSKGGSHLCAKNYCRRYRPAARMPQAIDTSTSHLGFRCVVRDQEAARPRSMR